jgi:integrase
MSFRPEIRRFLSLNGAVTRPQAGVQSVFESGERKGVWPGLTVEDRCDHGVVDSSHRFDGSQWSTFYCQLEFFDEQSNRVRDRVTSRTLGPVWAEFDGFRSRRARHITRLRNRQLRELPLPGFCHTPLQVLSVITDITWIGELKVAQRIDRYAPQVDARTWDRISGFVRSAVHDAEPSTVYDASSLLSSVSGFVGWADQTGHSLNRTALFDRWLIEEYIANGCPTLSSASRGNRRSHLFRVAEVLLGPSFAGPKPVPLLPSDPVRPYTATELEMLKRWANGQPRENNKADATVLLALGVGAGLAVEDLLRIKQQDLTEDNDGVLVTVVGGRRPRQVPVLHMWTYDLSPMIAGFSALTANEFVFRPRRKVGSKNSVTNFVARTTNAGVRVSSQRLRATWIVTHLTAGTPVVPLMQVAGVDSLEALTRYVRYVPQIDPARSRQWLQGNQ